jgi:hypothetical protein
MRSYRWIPETGAGLEHLVLWQEGAAQLAQGVVIGERDGPLHGTAYTLRCDLGWRVREATIDVAGGGYLRLFSDGEGHWRGEDGQPLDALAGCIDIDLTASCFTNTLPIRRLALAPGDRRMVDVVYVHIPGLQVEKTAQAYTRLGSHAWRFESMADGFQAELEVDDDGLVVHYPGLFHRLD